ncbi:hypothetical protein FHX81_6823 [Saccharothrix saharensis]|uniref:Uncharacterized protein n=1 Tax=Saccharothrix saharensis TaxID=571190 RepID=A0A543JNG9_9PSEU|nr:hypothetical protein [Saccharothrix saharensis]TQM84379.1 hypothetical protein FHX81_6823 [Saccharothrix saharensis]
MGAGRSNSPGNAGRQFHTDSAFAVGTITPEWDSARVAASGGRWPACRGTGKGGRHGSRAPDHRDIGRVTWLVGWSDAQRVADVIEQFTPPFGTWRRRIAEEFVHQEGVSL